MRTVVVLPAPFVPRSPSIVPSWRARSRLAGDPPSYSHTATALRHTSWNAPSSQSDEKRQIPARLSHDVSVRPLLKQPLPLYKQESKWNTQSLGQQHRVDLAR